jgi:hypothetical protein
MSNRLRSVRTPTRSDGEQGIDARNGLACDRRLVDPGQIEELASRMGPTGSLDDRPSLAVGLVETGTGNFADSTCVLGFCKS